MLKLLDYITLKTHIVSLTFLKSDYFDFSNMFDILNLFLLIFSFIFKHPMHRPVHVSNSLSNDSISIIDNNYYNTLRGIEFIKYHFLKQLKRQLCLLRVSAPLFLDPETGLNDDLNGIERKVSFTPAALKGSGKKLEVVQSLAKWKRYVIWKYGLGDGIVADMNAIRQDEQIDQLHSLYVDQWDWEKPISNRSPHLLHAIVQIIFQCIN